MSLLSRLFGSKKGAKSGPAGLEERLKDLEAEAESARPGYQGTPYNKAGDVALRDGDKGRAITYYGRAIDAFLEDAQREAARGVANKIIRVHPKAVRTLCTLTWLDLASQHRATALLHLRDYVEAAKEVEENVRAAEQVYEMARLSVQSEFLDAAADALDSLGFDERAVEVRGWVASGGSADALAEPEELAAACVTGAVTSNTGEVAEKPAGDEASAAADADSDQAEGSQGAEDATGVETATSTEPVTDQVADQVDGAELVDVADSEPEAIADDSRPEPDVDNEDQAGDEDEAEPVHAGEEAEPEPAEPAPPAEEAVPKAPAVADAAGTQQKKGKKRKKKRKKRKR